MADLTDVQTFSMVLQQRSFTRAAELLGVSAATVSRRVARLEAELGVRLLTRDSRRVVPTELGMIYAQELSSAINLIELAEEKLHAARDTMHGVLRVAAPSVMLQGFIGELLVEWAGEHPELQIHAMESGHTGDFDRLGVDVAILAVTPTLSEVQAFYSEHELVTRTLGWMDIVLCASPDYLERHGPITQPEDLAEKPCVVIGASADSIRVLFRNEENEHRHVHVNARVFTTSVPFNRRAAIQGLGIAGIAAPDCHGPLKRGELVRVLPEWSLEPVRIAAYYPRERSSVLKVERFLDLLSTRLSHVFQ